MMKRLGLECLFGAVLLVVLLILSTMQGCSDGDGRARLVVYSPHGEDILREFEQSFEAAHPDVDVRTFNLPSMSCLDRIRAEAASPNCDVWWGAPMSAFQLAADAGLLEAVRPSWAEHVDPNTHHPDDLYYGHFLMPQVIAFNRERLAAEDAPADWDDLLTDEWDDRIVLRYPMPSGSMRASFASLVDWKWSTTGEEQAGFDYLAGLHRNTKRYATDPAELFEAVKKDQDDIVTIWNLTDCLFQRDRHGYPFGIVFPHSGLPVVIDCIALVKQAEGSDPDSKRAAAARAFYEFVTGIEALDSLMTNHWRIPTRSDVPDERKPEWLRDLRFEPLPVDPVRMARNERAWMTRWEETIKPLTGD